MKSNPLLDVEFLKKLDNQTEHEIYAKIISLDFEENPIEEITGRVTGGSLNIDGSSAVRRTCSVTMAAQEVNINDFYWGLNTKFCLYIGIRNFSDEAYDDIIWFKQGIFLITSFSTSYGVSEYTISISGKDKMCLLNGDVGGVMTALTTDFGKYQQVDADGNIIKIDYPIKEIIMESVHHYAGEPYHNIIIEDLEEQGLALMDYKGDADIYLLINANAEREGVSNLRFAVDGQPITGYFYEDGKPIADLTKDIVFDSRITRFDATGSDLPTPTIIKASTDDNTQTYTVAKIQYGDTCGFRLQDLIYPDDLLAEVGSSLTSAVLDKLTEMLGDFEYFYDVDGRFHFQRKRIYYNKSWNSIHGQGGSQYEEFAENSMYSTPYSYSFVGSNLVTSFSNNPSYENLKNDFSIWGSRQISSDVSVPFHLRYAIDQKPVYYKAYDGTVYEAKKNEEDKGPNKFDWRELIYQMAVDYFKHQHDDDFLITVARNNPDYFPTGITGYEPYYTDIQGFWRDLYNPEDAKTSIDLEEVQNLKSQNNYYVWDKDKHKFDEHSFRDSTDILPVEEETNGSPNHYYYKGNIITLEEMVDEILEYEDQLAKTNDNYYQRMLDKIYPDANIREALIQSYKDDDIEKAKKIVKQIYPLYQYLGDDEWREFFEYKIYDKNTTYYEFKLAKDLTKISADGTYYAKNEDAKYILQPVKEGFKILLTFYKYKGFTKTGIVGKNASRTYYSYNEYIKAINMSGQEDFKFYSLSEDEQGNKIMNYVSTSDIVQNHIDISSLYLVANEDVLSDENVFAYYPEFTVNSDINYYQKVTVNGQDTRYYPESFIRGETYYYENSKGEEVEAFTFNNDITYYVDEGYEEIFSLKSLPTPGYYTEKEDSTQEVPSLSVLDSGKKWYCYVPVENVSNDYYYIRTSDGRFEEYNVLKTFERGKTYYRFGDDYAEVNPYADLKLEVKDYYVYNGHNTYKSVEDIINSMLDSNGKLSDEKVLSLVNKYGIKVYNNGELYGLSPLFNFYTYEENQYWPVDYYEFAFYEPDDEGEYIKNGAEYIKPNSDEDNSKVQHYTKLTNGDLQVYTSDAFNPETGWTTELEYPENLIFWFDFLDIDQGDFAQFSVHNIGDRPKAVNDDSVKAIYYRDTPTVIFCGAEGLYRKVFITEEVFNNPKDAGEEIFYEKTDQGNYQPANKYSANKDYYRKLTAIDKRTGYTYITINDTIDNLFTLSPQGKSAYNVLEEFLYDDAYCTQSISISSIPIYYLQPNTKISVYDKESHIDGDYIISSMSIPLAYNSTMSITATKAIDRII